jgi:hypothetical protein
MTMAEIFNCTLNFGSGRPPAPALTCRPGKLASAEVERDVLALAAVPESS